MHKRMKLELNKCAGASVKNVAILGILSVEGTSQQGVLSSLTPAQEQRIHLNLYIEILDIQPDIQP